MGLFDGLGTLMLDTFGAAHVVTPVGGPAVELQATFQEAPLSVLDASGQEVWTSVPTLEVDRTDVAICGAGAVVQVEDGRRYRFTGDQLPSDSSAVDALVKLIVELV
jgi:hypothetical protein